MKPNVSIRPFRPTDQTAIENLVLTIQRIEFGLDLTADNQLDLKDVGAYFRGSGSAFWVAVSAKDDAVIGCIGLESVAGPLAIMRKFMVAQAWRGRPLGVAHALHAAFLQHARAINASKVVLSTVVETKAAQSFYTRLGYRCIERGAMPVEFVPGILDAIFMVLDMDV
jgi:GNAT superfamily N-acetyltransferase